MLQYRIDFPRGIQRRPELPALNGGCGGLTMAGHQMLPKVIPLLNRAGETKYYERLMSEEKGKTTHQLPSQLKHLTWGKLIYQ